MLEEKVAELLPSAARIYKGFADNGWRCYSSDDNLSRSWVLRPPRLAIYEVLMWAWERHEKETPERCNAKRLMDGSL